MPAAVAQSQTIHQALYADASDKSRLDAVDWRKFVVARAADGYENGAGKPRVSSAFADLKPSQSLTKYITVPVSHLATWPNLCFLYCVLL